MANYNRNTHINTHTQAQMYAYIVHTQNCTCILRLLECEIELLKQFLAVLRRWGYHRKSRDRYPLCRCFCTCRVYFPFLVADIGDKHLFCLAPLLVREVTDISYSSRLSLTSHPVQKTMRIFALIRAKSRICTLDSTANIPNSTRLCETARDTYV